MIRKRFAAISIALVGLAACQPQNPQASIEEVRDQLKRHEAAVAEIGLKNLLQVQPETAEARYLMGVLLFRGGNYKLAEIELRKALKAGYPADEVVPALARSLLRQGRHQQMVEEFQDTQLNSPDGRASLAAVLASALLLQKKVEAADRLVEDALKVAPHHPAATTLRARRMAVGGQAAAALALMQDSVKRHQAEVDSWVLLAEMQLALGGDRAAAEASYRGAVAADPLSVAAHAGLLGLLLQQQDFAKAELAYAQMRKRQPRHPQTVALGVHFDYQAGRLTAARRTVAELLKQAPGEARLLQMAAMIELKSGSAQQAESLAQKALKSEPDLLSARLLLARAQSELHQPERVLGTLKPLLAKDGAGQAEVLGLAGQAELSLGRADAALQLFRKAAALEPRNQRLQAAQALANIAAGGVAEGVAELERLSVESGQTYADLALVSEQMRLKHWDEAIEAARKLAQKLPKKALPLQLEARIELARGRLPEARKRFEAALAAEPAALGAQVELAELDIRERRFKEAEQGLREVLKAQPGQARAVLDLASTLQQSGRPADEVRHVVEEAVRANPLDVNLRLRWIEGLRAAGDRKAVLSAAQDAHAALPNAPEVLDALGLAQQEAGERKQAAGSFQRLALLQPGSSAPLIRVAELQRLDGETDKAIASMRRAVALEPQHVGVYRAAIALSLQLDKHALGIEFAKALQRALPRRHEGAALEGEVLTHQKAWPEAVSAYRRALALPDSGVVALQLHRAYRLAQRDAEAQRFAATWLQAHPDDVRFLFHLGDTATQAADWPEAERWYREVLRRQAGNGWAMNNLAWALSKQGKPEARALVQQALVLLPEAASLHHTASWVHALAGDAAAARAAAERAVQLAPANSQFLLRAADLALDGGRKSQAEAWLDRAAQQARDDKAVVAEVARLRTKL